MAGERSVASRNGGREEVGEDKDGVSRIRTHFYR